MVTWGDGPRWNGARRDGEPCGVVVIERDRMSPACRACCAIAAALVLAVAVAAAWWTQSDRSAENRERAQLEAWAGEFRSDTPEALAAIFDRCAALDVRAAIPNALLYAIPPRGGPHCEAARRFLLKYDRETIRDETMRAAARLEDATALLARLEEWTR